MKQLIVIATLDTKGREADYARSCAEAMGAGVCLVDVGTTEPQVAPAVGRHEVAAAAGRDLDQLLAGKDRSLIMQTMAEGGAVLARRLLQEGRLDGVLGMGGGSGTGVITSIMRPLPFGIPKVMVSTVASRDVREYVGTRDIVMFHSVADLLGFNDFMRRLLGQAVAAVCAMMEHARAPEQAKPMIAVSAYGINSRCALNAEPLINAKGYEMIGFHANGCGGMAMEEMIGEGLIAGVLDFTPHEIADEMFGGYCRGIGPDRLETAGRMGVPLVFAPGGLDNAVFSPFYPMPPELAGRRTHVHDIRYCVRMEASEMEAFAAIIAGKLNKSKGPLHVLVPLKGWSEADREGSTLFDPGVDRVFVDRLKSLLKPAIPVEELDVHISDRAFAERAVDVLHAMIESRRTPVQAVVGE
jgi:uncharacterized protein (UPF0261 family)